jgi:hypothetical protein
LVIQHGHTDIVHQAMLSPDGMRLITVSRDGTAMVMPMFATTQQLIDAARSRGTRQLSGCELARFFLAPPLEAELCGTSSLPTTMTHLSS